LFSAMPTEQVICCCSATWCRIRFPMVTGEPSSLVAPETSRNASSSDSGWTSGVTEAKIAMTSFDTAPYSRCRGGMTVACGQSRLARDIGIADRTPKALAS
jgi:hypothetical protein